jgi:hypothetical protein
MEVIFIMVLFISVFKHINRKAVNRDLVTINGFRNGEI